MLKITRFICVIIICLMGCSGNSGDTHIEQGSEYFLDANFEAAKNELRKALNKPLYYHTKEELYTILGNTYQELETYDSAIVYHKKALELDPDYVEAWVNLGVVYRLTSEFELAEECYNKAKSLNPNDPELHASLGALYIYKGDVDKAIEYLERSVELDPDLAIAHSNLAYALALIGQYDKADQELGKAINLGYRNGELMQQRIDELRYHEE